MADLAKVVSYQGRKRLKWWKGHHCNAIKGTDLRDKVVIDVGAGSGVLAMLAAKNKARKVYAGTLLSPLFFKTCMHQLCNVWCCTRILRCSKTHW